MERRSTFVASSQFLVPAVIQPEFEKRRRLEMGLSYIYKIGADEFDFPAQYLDWTKNFSADFSNDLNILFDVEDVDEWGTDDPHAVVRYMDATSALERIINELETNKQTNKHLGANTGSILRSFRVSL